MSNKNQDCIIKIIASKKSWIEGKAIEQLHHTASLPGMKYAIGLPDLHPGMGHPVGAVFISKNVFYPQLAGSDIGCGMGLWQTSLSVKKVRIDKLVKKLKGLNSPCTTDLSFYKEKYQLDEQNENQLGTIGGGNHFAELQKIESIEDESRFKALGLNEDQSFLLVHSGSRALGKKIYDSITNCSQGLKEHSTESLDYLKQHAFALRWAKANREVIAMRFAEQMGAKLNPILDVCHNEISNIRIDAHSLWLHRKGASSSQQGAVIIPGSRGHFSYLVQPSDVSIHAGFSLAHGAGRKWQRSAAKSKLKERYSPQDLQKTSLKSSVICEDDDLIYEEAPQAYKNVETVIQDLIDEGLITIIAILRPLLTYKTRRGDGKK